MIHIRDIKECIKLLEESKEELERIYGDRVIQAIPLHKKITEFLKQIRDLRW